MTDARSSYDESNEVWPYLTITLLGSFLIPLTVGQLFQLFRTSKHEPGVSAEHRRFRASRARKSLLSNWKPWLVLIGWIVVAVLVNFIRSGENTSEDAETWDPYEVLKIAKSATSKEIKSAYRKLSLQFHPDKVKDVSEAAKEEIDAIYVDITKAYRALTDEDTRQNFLLYGHPDGPQPVTHGIALPAFLFNPTMSVAFVGLYLLGFGIGLPLIVGAVWTESQKRTRHGLLQESAAQFCELMAKEQPHFINRQRILDEVLSSADMTVALGPEKYTLEQRHELLNSYLSRKQPQTDKELVVASEASRILMGMHTIAAGFKSVILCHRIIELRRAVVQAVPFDKLANGSVLQLANASSGKPSNEESGLELIKRVENARAYLPRLGYYGGDFRVLGAKQVYTNSSVYLEIKYTVIPLGDAAPKPSKDVLDHLSLGESETPDKYNKSKPIIGPAVAPYFPEAVPATWQIYIYNDGDKKLMEKPLELSHMDLRNLALTRAQFADNEGIHYDTITVPFSTPTPAQPVKAVFKLVMLNTAYFDCDVRAPVVMDVNVAPPMEKVIEDDISENEDNEDSEEDMEGLSDIDTSTDDETDIDAVKSSADNLIEKK